MKKFKILLVIFLLPFTFIIYYFTSEQYGISAYIEKQKTLDIINNNNAIIKNDIMSYKNKIELLKKEIPDIDLLNEKALETLGISDKGSLVINIENL